MGCQRASDGEKASRISASYPREVGNTVEEYENGRAWFFPGMGPPPDNDGGRRHVPTNSSPSSLIFLSSVGVFFSGKNRHGRPVTSRGETMVGEMRKSILDFTCVTGVSNYVSLVGLPRKGRFFD